MSLQTDFGGGWEGGGARRHTRWGRGYWIQRVGGGGRDASLRMCGAGRGRVPLSFSLSMNVDLGESLCFYFPDGLGSGKHVRRISMEETVQVQSENKFVMITKAACGPFFAGIEGEEAMEGGRGREGGTAVLIGSLEIAPTLWNMTTRSGVIRDDSV